MIKIINYTKNPLSLMGEVASTCWNSKSSPQIGIDCIESGHGRILEYPDVIVSISEYSARTIRQIYTHIIGISRVQESTRYVGYNNFNYIVPESIYKNKLALKKYLKCMQTIKESYIGLKELKIPKEDIANILPLGMTSKIVLKINARAILHMAEIRLCNRAYWEIRRFMEELLGVISRLDDEWLKIVSYAKPKCEILGYCNEKNSCGKYPKNKE